MIWRHGETPEPEGPKLAATTLTPPVVPGQAANPAGAPKRYGSFMGTFVGFLMVGGIAALLLSCYLLLSQPNVPQSDRDLGILVILLLGSFGVGPLFMIFFMVFLHPVNRIKAKRAMTKKNYGYVNLVTRGNVIITKVMDFNTALLRTGSGIWEMNPRKIFKQVGIGQELDEGVTIKAEDIHILSGIPSIYISIDTMKPLSFFVEKGDANPTDLAATLDGYIMNQLAKNMFFKKTFSIMIVIAIIVAGAAAVIAWQNHTDIATMMEDWPKVVDMSNQFQGVLEAAQQPKVVG
jgi:hypothetical protein